jgi:RimJ/RimL family protein N-acetyltransferase
MTLLPDQLGAGAIELRRSRPSYLDDVMSAVTLSYPELHRWINWCKSMPLRQDILKFLEEDERAFEVDEKWAYALFERDSGELVGSAGLRKVSAPATDGLEIGYWVRSDRTKLGYASAAAQALVDAGFAKMPGIKRMRISMDSANEASAAVPRKLGFRFLGNEKGELATEGHTGAGAVWELERPW